jgi:hypothetical protein
MQHAKNTPKPSTKKTPPTLSIPSSASSELFSSPVHASGNID